MKKLILLLTIALFSLTTFAQSDIYLRIGHQIGSEELIFDEEYTEPTQGYDFSISRLQYYISEITITHDGGQQTLLSDTWILVNAESGDNYYLGKQDVIDVEGISFSIGVDPDHNHLDPTLYPPGHPLAPQNPSMHWGWAAGYRFAALEGNTGFNLIFNYEIHALGDDNYFSQFIPTAAYTENNTIVIPIEADYLGLYKNIDVSSGMIEHGESGAAKLLLENFSDQVFSQLAFTGLNTDIASDENAALHVYPNPSTTGYSTIKFDQKINEPAMILKVTDMTGREILRDNNFQNHSTLKCEFPTNGLYFVNVYGSKGLVASEKIVVSK